MPMNEPVNIIDPVKRLGLDADPNDRANVVRALKERVKELHPDRTGGKFESEEAKCAFLEAQTTLATVEAAETMALMPLREITSLVEGLAKSVVPLWGSFKKRFFECSEQERFAKGLGHTITHLR